MAKKRSPETVQELAGEARKYFKRVPRKGTEDYIWTLTANTPDWVRELSREAHDEMLPDDHKFEYIVGALSAIEDAADPNEIGEAGLEPDVYNHDLLQWLSSSLKRIAYVDEALDEYGGDSKSIMDIISFGQLKEREEVYAAVLEALKSRRSHVIEGTE